MTGVNQQVVIGVIGTLIKFQGIVMLLPLLISFIYGEPLHPFVVAIFITVLSGVFIERRWGAEGTIQNKEAMAIVALAWLMAGLFGSIPYVLSGIGPLDAMFEAMSGFTTTGSTILPDIESCSKGLLLWRSMTQWLGGMGIVVLFLAILPKLSVAGRQLFKAEVPGPTEERLEPRVRATARILWLVYVFFTTLEAVLLYFAGVDPYEALATSFSTMATGGFHPQAQSIGAYGSVWVEGIVLIFMFLAGVSFTLHYRVIRGDKRGLFMDREFHVYVGLLIVATILLTTMLASDGLAIVDALRLSAFQSVSVMTTTGFVSTDYDMWGWGPKILLFTLMFVGGSAGSTGGSMKVIRILILLKLGYRELFKSIHPKAVRPIWVGNRVVTEDVISSVTSFFILYILTFIASGLLLTILGLDMLTALSAAATTIGNVGPGFGAVGPMSNFAAVHPFGKIILILNMWIGRLEIFTVLVLLVPEFWKE